MPTWAPPRRDDLPVLGTIILDVLSTMIPRGTSVVRTRCATACVVLLLLACLIARAEAQDAFVRTEGTAFTIAGEPFAFVGANVAVMHGPVHRAALEATLDGVVEDGVTVVRVWALGEYPEGAPEWADLYAFRRGTELFVEGGAQHLDRVLVACRERGLRVIVVLANRWGDYGGLPQYLHWAEIPYEPSEGGIVGELDLPLFFASVRARALYEAHVTHVVSRTNALSGVAYRDDPTIFAWELWNEISAPPRARAQLVEMLERSADLIRAIDPNHLISAGHIGYEFSRDRRTWEAAITARGIDYADAHAYPTRYGHVRNLRELDRWIGDRARVARDAGRPLIFGEVGFTTTAPRVGDVPRARYLDQFFRSARRHGVSGVLPWIYAPSGDHPREHTLFIDGEGVRRTRDLRRVIARHARRFVGFDPRTAPMPEVALPERVLLGSPRAHDAWGPDTDPRRSVLHIAPEAFLRARFEAVGRAGGPRSEHVYGMGDGFVRYRFTSPPRARALRRLTIRFRASSELAGTGEGSSPEDTSEVVVRIDDVVIGRVVLPIDDGFGAIVEVTTEDPAALSLLRRGTHTLELRIESPDAPGLCLYGRPVAAEAEIEPRSEIETRTEIETLSEIEIIADRE